MKKRDPLTPEETTPDNDIYVRLNQVLKIPADETTAAKMIGAGPVISAEEYRTIVATARMMAHPRKAIAGLFIEHALNLRSAGYDPIDRESKQEGVAD